MGFKNTVLLNLALLLLASLFIVAGKVVPVRQMSGRNPDVATIRSKMVPNLFVSDPTFPWVGIGVKFFINSSVQYVSCSDYVYVSHGWVTPNWSSFTSQAQSAFLDHTQTNFTLETNASGFANPALAQFTYYNSTEDSMTSLFWFQFYPGDLAPGDYSFTGTWQEAAAANPPNYTAIHEQRTVTLGVNLANSTTSVSLSPDLGYIGQPVDCNATVSGLNATGTINWTTSSSTGSFNSSVGILSSESVSTIYVNNNFTGLVTITASYSGDGYNAPSTGSAVLTVFVNISTGVNVTVTPTSNLQLTFANVTAAGYTVANETPTANAPALNITGQYYDIKVTATFLGNVTVSLAFDGSSMTLQQKSNLQMMQYRPIPGDIRPAFGVVDMRDIGYMAKHFGTTNASPSWDPSSDITGPTYLVPDGKVDMRDLGLAAKNFGKTANWVNITTNVDTTNNIIYGQTTHFSLIAIH